MKSKPCPPLVAAMFKAHEVPEPVTEAEFCEGRKWRFDYFWPNWDIALEIEGGVWTKGRHTRGKGFLGDVEKYNEAAILGISVLRATPEQLNSGEAAALVSRMMNSLLPEISHPTNVGGTASIINIRQAKNAQSS